MLKSIHKKYFEVWGDEQSQNSILKGLLAFGTLINITLIITLIILATQKPFLISMEKNKTNILKPSQAIPSEFIRQEIKRSLSRFIKLKHNWSYKNIGKRLKEATIFIEKNSRSKFLKANQNNIKTAKKRRSFRSFTSHHPFSLTLKNNKLKSQGIEF